MRIKGSYVCSQDKEPRGIIPLENLSIREVEEPRKPVSSPLMLRLHHFLELRKCEMSF